MKNIGYRPRNLRDIARALEIKGVEEEIPLKYTDAELANLIVRHIDGLERRLEAAKRVYREQRDMLDKLQSPELWRFEAPKSVPPDYRAEYLRRLKQGAFRPIDENGRVIVVKKA